VNGERICTVAKRRLLSSYSPVPPQQRRTKPEAATCTKGLQDEAENSPLCLPPKGEKPCNAVSLGDTKTERSLREEQASNPVGRRKEGHLGPQGHNEDSLKVVAVEGLEPPTRGL
jgi:hypothetical protein